MRVDQFGVVWTCGIATALLQKHQNVYSQHKSLLFCDVHVYRWLLYGSTRSNQNGEGYEIVEKLPVIGEVFGFVGQAVYEHVSIGPKATKVASGSSKLCLHRIVKGMQSKDNHKITVVYRHLDGAFDVGKFYEIHLNYTVLRRGDVHLMMWSIVNVWPDAHWPTTSSEPLSCTWQAMH